MERRGSYMVSREAPGPAPRCTVCGSKAARQLERLRAALIAVPPRSNNNTCSSIARTAGAKQQEAGDAPGLVSLIHPA